MWLGPQVQAELQQGILSWCACSAPISIVLWPLDLENALQNYNVAFHMVPLPSMLAEMSPALQHLRSVQMSPTAFTFRRATKEKKFKDSMPPPRASRLCWKGRQEQANLL